MTVALIILRQDITTLYLQPGLFSSNKNLTMSPKGRGCILTHLFGPVLSTEKVLSLWLPNECKLRCDNVIDSQDLVIWPSSVTLQMSELRNQLGKIHKFPAGAHSVPVKVLVIYNPKFNTVFRFIPSSSRPTSVYCSSVGMCHC